MTLAWSRWRIKKILSMIRKLISLSTALSIIGLAVPVLAVPAGISMELETPGITRTLLLPPAADSSPVISLGTAIDPRSGREVEGYAFIHYKDEQARGGGVIGKSGAKCYAFLANGARWKITENYLFDPTNNRGLASETLRTLFGAGTETWDSRVAFDVFGAETAGIVDGADSVSPDGKNEVLFGDVGSSGAIAVTIVWGVFGGPTFQRHLVEWDMVFDDVDFDWSTEAAGVSGKMDFLNIAVHEVGHAGGMAHPGDSCTEESMFRFSGFAEIKKRDLNTGDISGITALYK